jgi:putative ATP-binding cassette transporter
MTDIAAHESFEQPNEGIAGLLRQVREFLVALWSSPGRATLNWLSMGIISVILATAAAQVALNFWNRPFYNAIQARDFRAFAYQLLVFLMIAGTLLILNVAQAWLREMFKLKTREWVSRDLFVQWLMPGRSVRLSHAGEIGVNPDQRIHEDTRRLTELSADLGIGLFQSALLLLSFLGVLWTLSGPLVIPIGGITFTIPGYMVWCALLYAATGSWLTWRVGRPLVRLNAMRYQRESELRVALVQTNEHAESIAHGRQEEFEQRRLVADLANLLDMVRQIVGAIARLTWVTAGYGWVSLVAPIVIAAPSYFGGKLNFGELMMVVGGFYQVNQSLRWFVDNFALLADWRATLQRVMGFRETLLTFGNGVPVEERIAHSEKPANMLILENLHIEKQGEKAELDEPKLEMAPGERIHIVDKTRSGRSPLLAAIAGLWPAGKGKVESPSKAKMMFLKRRPYFPRGSLREALAYPTEAALFSDEKLRSALARAGLAHLGGALGRDMRCGIELSDAERTRIGLVQLLLNKPEWILAEEILNGLADEDCELISSLLRTELASSALIHIGRGPVSDQICQRVIHMTSKNPVGIH